MADDTATKASSFLTHKIGPLPMWAWMAIGGGLYLYFRNQQSKTTTTGTNQQTDPAGNIGSIDPATGYVYGTPEDLAALAANNAGTSTPSGSGSSGQSGTTGGQTFADNNAWGIAAINVLVGLGIDATTANQAIELYLTSQPLTASQQADVNLAIGRLGPPPSLPGPVSGNPPPVTGPPQPGTVTVPKVTGLTASAAVAALQKVGLKAGSEGANGGSAIVNSQTPGAGAKVAQGSTVDLGVVQHGGIHGNPPPTPKSAAPPTGLVVTAKHSTSVGFKWNRSPGATGYDWTVTDMATKAAKSGSAGTALTATAGGLTGGHSYVIDVWALPRAAGNSQHAEVSVTLPRTG